MRESKNPLKSRFSFNLSHSLRTYFYPDLSSLVVEFKPFVGIGVPEVCLD